MKNAVVALTLAAAAAAGLVVSLLPPPSAVQAEPAITPVVCKLGELPPCVGTPPPVIYGTPTPAHVLYLADLRK